MSSSLRELMVSFFSVVRNTTADEPEIHEKMSALFYAQRTGQIASKEVATRMMDLLAARPELLAQARAVQPGKDNRRV